MYNLTFLSVRMRYKSLLFLSIATMVGTDYNDFMATNPYHTFDSSQVPYGFKSSML